MSRWRTLWLLVIGAWLVPSGAAWAQAPEEEEVAPEQAEGAPAPTEAEDSEESQSVALPSSSEEDSVASEADSESDEAEAQSEDGESSDAVSAEASVDDEALAEDDADSATCSSTETCLPPEHSTMFRLSLGGGLRHDEIEGLAGASLDLGLRPLFGMLLMSLSFSGATNADLQIVSAGVLVEFDLSHFFASEAFTWQPDRDRWWGLSIGGRLGITYSVLREHLFEGLEPAEFRLMRPEIMLMAEFRFRPWSGEALGTRLLFRVEHHLSIGLTSSRTIFLLGVSQEFSP